MTDSIKRLKELADKEKQQRPFAKIDKIEKELHLDDAPDTDKEDSSAVPTNKKEKQLLGEQGIIELTATQKIGNNQNNLH